MLLQAAGATLIGLAGGAVLWSGDAIGASFGGGIQPELGVDRLSGVFLLMLGIAERPGARVRRRLPRLVGPRPGRRGADGALRRRARAAAVRA